MQSKQEEKSHQSAFVYWLKCLKTFKEDAPQTLLLKRWIDILYQIYLIENIEITYYYRFSLDKNGNITGLTVLERGKFPVGVFRTYKEEFDFHFKDSTFPRSQIPFLLRASAIARFKKYVKGY
ncbi:MAG: hypothetical protein HWN66_15740 [Candidatus Helarchaeota archaeon]|nr:hypothetical protein [Candidatus Helarchaeota archaeon]